MKNISVDYGKGQIVVSSAFMKKVSNPLSAEYAQLQTVRRDNPTFELVVREFKKNTNQEHYYGLTYDYMRDYIKYAEGENADAVLEIFEKQVAISKAHSTGRRYPVIKAWFLKRYPEFTEFGMTVDELKKWRETQAA